ncbi:TPA: chemotaxis protein CheW [Listeria innocua]|uniref:Chemotaxis protein CheA n=1 Tax=Listeria innocua serovar 6a (strain ATCC BAA-680 / CLIP 11262) TaxID=272626 RepID=CHEA_LISIN|nr:chemotaxis protein CheA [Listeria innocua]Q92DW2.1 RecName: Full=Chemotaxis protein CheA [Listeria innocua Clip11262]ECC1680766.1 chemotaxis protein CheA [Listeria innocua]EEQ0535910.1 chemotaxis protein CheA [Listeria innocua]EHD9218939.1 chemotaxis protein CheA [Listeria innocua]EHF3594565.1 chemotaxis protein CheA [Listeria innocua]EHF3597526.1 chemotaxis protein CheA [Listeria innocua]
MTTNMLDLFIEEASEHLQALNDNLLQLEKDPTNGQLVSEIFRSAHTFKGMSATMGFQQVADLTHAMENVLDEVRNNRLAVTEHLVDIIFTCTSHLETMVSDIQHGGQGAADISKTVADLEALLHPEQETDTAVEKTYRIAIQIEEAAILKAVRAVMCLERLAEMGIISETTPDREAIELEEFEHSFEVVLETAQTKEEIEAVILDISEIEKVTVTEEVEEVQIIEPIKKAAKQTTKRLENKTIRVQLEKIEKLMNVFEESVIERARIDEIAEKTNNKELMEHLGRFSSISKEIQNGLLNMRMVPVDSVFNRFPKMVRTLAKELGKKIDLVIEGADTEVDKIVIDEIGDPLVHLIRNSVDHGAETVEVRRKNGKNETATINLKAFHSGNNVVIEIVDDGAGINKRKVLEKAIAKNVVTRAESTKMTDSEIFDLLFDSGFSTADQVSDLSGRGVGLDVVRNTILKIGGKISVESSENAGSTFRIEIPLTLSIIQSMLVATSERRYAVPLANVAEAITINPADIQHVHGKDLINYRETIIEVLDLGECFHETPLTDTDELLLLVVKNAKRTFGLIIKDIIGQREIVLKTLGGFFSESQIAFSGATILGDGRVVLILNLETF